MPEYVDISKNILNWISTSVPMDDFNEKSRNYLKAWISGDKKATFNQIEEVSKSTGIPLGYFFMKAAPHEDASLVEYRTLKSVPLKNPSRNLIETIQTMERIQEWIREELIEEGFSTLSFVGQINQTVSIYDFADEIRRFLGLELDWFNKVSSDEKAYALIKSKISDECIYVMQNGIVGNNTHRPLNINEFRAFSLIDEYAPLIFINSNDSVKANIFSILHELAHIFVGEKCLYNGSVYDEQVSPIETLCNKTAAEVLVPRSIFEEEWKEKENLDDTDDVIKIIRSLTSIFNCSESVIARRAYDCNFIEHAEYLKIIRTASTTARWTKKETTGGDFYRTLLSKYDHHFLNMLIGSVRSGRTSYTDAFGMTATGLKSFQGLIEHLEGGK